MAMRLQQAEDAADWTYRGEGAANLVLGYRGSSSSFVGKVLRLQKIPRKGGAEAERGAPVLSAHERMLWEDVSGLGECSSKEVVEQLFALHVMSPLLGPQHVDPGVRVQIPMDCCWKYDGHNVKCLMDQNGQIWICSFDPLPPIGMMHVVVSEEFLQSVEKNILDQRPIWRVDAAKVNTSCDSALLMSDHSFFPHGALKENLCITVEIKPKSGFLPSSKFIRRENVVKTYVTRFKMHQALKLHEGQISRISDYEPPALFSGSRERIRQAIMALFHCPQNNFRVFFNGSLVFGALGGLMDKSETVSDDSHKRNEAFEDLLKVVIQGEHGQCLPSFLELVGEAIFSSGIMTRLLEVQKLDLFDIEGAIHAYYNIISEPCLICENLSDAELLNRCSSLHSLTLEESLKIVKWYLIAATAKDCSLMISFRPRDENVASDFGSVFLDSTSQTFDYKAYFIDLDMKPLSKMAYYYELDQKIVELYKNGESTRMNDGNSTCSC